MNHQFALFRILFGSYLLVHFLALLPHGAELFSSAGLLADPSLNPTFGIFPNHLYVFDSPLAVSLTLGTAVLASLAFTLGVARRTSALVLWFILTALFHRNNLIANPSLPYVGLVLLLSALVPLGEPLALRRKPDPDWSMPRWIIPVATLLLALGYTFSGWTKLASPSWIDGSALAHILENPLARPGFARTTLLSLPPAFLAIATWGALVAELLYLPLTLIRKTRPWIWLALVAMHLGLIMLIDFADLSIGMLMIHLFTFDPRWLPSKVRSGSKLRVAFDADCLMCNRSVHLLAEQDTADRITFEPLPDGSEKSTMLARVDNETHRRSAAVLAILDALGGHWRAIGLLARPVPRPILDRLYDLVAKNRHRFFRKTACELPSDAVRKRLVDPSPQSTRRLDRLGGTLAVLLATVFLLGCNTAAVHNGRFPFSLMEIPPGGNHLDEPDAAFTEIARYAPGDDFSARTKHIRPGDVIAFHMSHQQAWNHLRKRKIQKIPYELFTYGHLALAVRAPATTTGSEIRLLQLAMKQPANIDDGAEYLRDKSWIHYRPTSPIDNERLDEFVTVALTNASDPKKAYDYSGTLGIHNQSTTPATKADIAHEYTCVTIVQAALHYAGHPTNSTRRNGFADIISPAQLIHSSRKE